MFIILLIIVPLFTAFLIPLFDIIKKKSRRYLVLTGTFLEISIFIIFTIFNFNKIINGDLFITYYQGGWIPPLGINLTMDMLAFYFTALISFSVMFLVIYSIGYIGHHEGKYYVLLFLLWSAMQSIILTSDMFNFYVFIELLLITSSPLVAFKRNRIGTEAAIKYMIYGIIGGLFIFVGVLILYLNLGTLNFADIHNHLHAIPQQAKSFIAVFFLIGLFIKLGIFPFHFWVAKAQSAAPSPISALLSGVVEKIYIYAYIRIFWFVFGFELLESIGINYLIIYLALFSSIIGHLLALYDDDLKRMLAYSTIGHLGIIIAVLTVNTKLAIMAGLLHVLSHLLMKISLFTSSGYLLQFTPTHKIKDNKGVAFKNLTVFSGFMVAAAGMMGLPPMIGFFSKLFIVQSFLNRGFYIAGSLVVLGSIIALIYYFRYITYGFKNITLEANDKFRLILSVFYRERVVTDIVMVFITAVLITGIFYKVLLVPLEEVVASIQDPSTYINYILGGY